MNPGDRVEHLLSENTGTLVSVTGAVLDQQRAEVEWDSPAATGCPPSPCALIELGPLDNGDWDSENS